MNFIHPQNVITKDNEPFNKLLICQQCSGVVVHPIECKKCQRAYCNNCIKKLTPRMCPKCKSKHFGNPHIQTKYYLEQITLKAACCNNIITYTENKNHYKSCPQVKKCNDCQTYYIITQNHLCNDNTKDVKNSNSNNEQQVTIVSDIPNTGRGLFIHRNVIRQNNNCRICNVRPHKFECFECDTEMCEICSPMCGLFGYSRMGKNLKSSTGDYFKGFKLSTFFIIYTSLNEDNVCSKKVFKAFYYMIGLLLDLVLCSIIAPIYVFIVPVVYFVIILLWFTFLTLLINPLFLIWWLLCLGLKRRCKKCSHL
jgi:hypothetical protein